MNKLFELNQSVDWSRSNVVIYGTGRMALLTHSTLLQEGVRVSAFCSPDGTNVDVRIMGKPVISLEELRHMEPTPLVIVAGEDPEISADILERLGISDLWCDKRAYDIVGDCVWSFM